MKLVRFFLLFFQVFILSAEDWDKIIYPFTTDPIDVVIPCVEKDLPTLELCIQGIKKYGEKIGRVIVVSKTKLTNSAEWFDESKYPFSKESLAFEIFNRNEREAVNYLNSSTNRIGWIFQQLLKLYAPCVIPDISPNVLVLDADMIFLNKTKFMEKNGAPIFDYAEENHEKYFEHASQVLPGLKRVHAKKSGIVNHMLFQKVILNDFFQMIEQLHKVEPWKALTRCIDSENLLGPCISEFEMYFNFVLSRTDQATVRKLKSNGILHLREIPMYQNRKYSYVFSHEWSRKAFGGSTNWNGTL